MSDKLRGSNEKILYLLILLGIGTLFFIFNLSNISAIEPTFCAERTISGAWCQNVPENQIDTHFQQAATYCENTLFCKLGTCIDGNQGLCRPNVPQRVCEESEGTWREGNPQDFRECQLGCCFMGSSASFVTQTRCTSLASEYGINSSFRGDIRDQTICLASANPEERGACVLDDGFTKKCRMETRAGCQQVEKTNSELNITFYKGLLCSAGDLGTICGRSKETTCVEDRDEVYFLDTCGNLANIYDASKIEDSEYWGIIKNNSESCNPESNNAGSATCGNCNYISGSTCKAYDRSDSRTPNNPTYGDFVCADLSCKYKGQTYKHGEEWCGTSPGINNSLPGSEYYKLQCYYGEVTSVQCDSFRQTFCVEGEIGGYSTAFCSANLWQSCVYQTNKEDCEDIQERDCKWVEGLGLTLSTIHRDEEGRPYSLSSNGTLASGNGQGAACIPKYAPGFEFWDPESLTGEEGTIGTQLCLIANENCIVKFEKDVGDLITGGSWDCKENCHCAGLRYGQSIDDAKLNSLWANQRNNMCISLGDCGNKKNWYGIQGYNTSGVTVTTRVG